MTRAIIYFLIVLFPFSGYTQEDYYNPGFIRYENHSYDPLIKTVILERSGQPLSDPVITLGTSEKLMLRFDYLTEEPADFSYRLIHCDASWKPSQLSEPDYLNGFFYEPIANYKYAFNTIQPYIHYYLEFPGEFMTPLISGNYLLVVYHTSDTEKIVLTRRFWIIEKRTEIETRIHRATDIGLRNTHHEADLNVMLNELQVQNPYGDIKLTMMQNNRWDNAVTGLKPSMFQNNILEYNYEEGNLFAAGNEFRNFDIRTTRFQTAFIDSTAADASGTYSVWLKKDPRKSYSRYAIEDDINGRYLIKVYEGRDENLEADYVHVNFTLPVTETYNGKVYIFGQLSDWKLSEAFAMKYDASKSAYTHSLYLKQGYYNYQYLVTEGNSQVGDPAPVEGSHYETGNDYYIFIYLKQMGDRYDRLVGFQKSGKP